MLALERPLPDKDIYVSAIRDNTIVQDRNLQRKTVDTFLSFAFSCAEEKWKGHVPMMFL